MPDVFFPFSACKCLDISVVRDEIYKYGFNKKLIGIETSFPRRQIGRMLIRILDESQLYARRFGLYHRNTECKGRGG